MPSLSAGRVCEPLGHKPPSQDAGSRGRPVHVTACCASAVTLFRGCPQASRAFRGKVPCVNAPCRPRAHRAYQPEGGADDYPGVGMAVLLVHVREHLHVAHSRSEWWSQAASEGDTGAGLTAVCMAGVFPVCRQCCRVCFCHLQRWYAVSCVMHLCCGAALRCRLSPGVSAKERERADAWCASGWNCLGGAVVSGHFCIRACGAALPFRANPLYLVGWFFVCVLVFCG